MERRMEGRMGGKEGGMGQDLREGGQDKGKNGQDGEGKKEGTKERERKERMKTWRDKGKFPEYIRTNKNPEIFKACAFLIFLRSTDRFLLHTIKRMG